MKEYHFDRLDSTQDYAKKIMLEGEEGFVVFTDVQTSGRGRFSRKWEGPNGGLWFSFDSDFCDRNGLFTITVGVAVREVLDKAYNYKVQLKWPNDLIIDNKKVGGIICEKIKDKVIVGIGINTNVKNISEEKAVTFFEKTGKNVDNYKIMNDIIKKCKAYLETDLDYIVKSFRENMAYRGEECFVSALNEKVKILDIASDGRLIVETNEEIKEVLSGEINECI